MAAGLPPALEQRLAALVPRVRALRVARGACGLLVAALASVAAVVLLDAAFALPAAARALCLAAWLTGVGVLAWRLVVRPLRADIPLAEVAGEIEKRLPKLGARLRSVADGPALGSPALAAAVAEDTARRARAADFAAAVPAWPVPWLLLTSSVVLAATSGVLLPGSCERLLRVAAPWHRGGAAALRVRIPAGEAGEQVVRRGGPVTLSAYAEKTGPGAAVPAEATLVYRDAPGTPECRLPMAGDGAAAFHVTLPGVTGDFEYRVEIGAAASGWFRVCAIDAAELAPGSTTELSPPPYALGRGTRTLPGFADLEGLQHGTAEFRLKFTRPATAALLDWRPDGATASGVVPLALAPDGLGATGTFRLRQGGVLKLVLETEANGKRLRTETPVAVRVAPDAPPEFEQLSGVTTLPRTARPGGSVRIEFAARDDVSVHGAQLEYVLDSFDSKSVTVPIPLSGAGTPKATGTLDFDLTDKGREGRAIYFRVHLLDNRDLDDPKLAPQRTTYPAAGWSELRLNASAPPLALQDVVCQRDEAGEALKAALGELKEAAREAGALADATAGRAALDVDHTVRLGALRDRVRRAAGLLDGLARDAALTPELRPLAAAAREVPDRALKPADDALDRVATAAPPDRGDAFKAASKHLTDAQSDLDGLLGLNARLARDRLDRGKLGPLAADQSALADSAKAGGADLTTRQRELLARLKALVAESDQLRHAADAARGAEARRLASALAELAAHSRDLDAAARQTTADARAALVAAVTRDQDALTARAAALLAKLETPARLAGVAPPRPEDFRRIADLATAGKTVEAVAELEKQALALERIAEAFDRWAGDRADPKLAAKQLALWQDDLLARFRAADFDKLPGDAKAALRAEQKALHAAVESLALPPDHAVKAARDVAVLHAGKANELLAADGNGADAAMKAAAEALNRLAEKTPAVAVRLAKTLGEFDKLRQEQDTIGNAVDAALKPFERQAPDAGTMAAAAKKLAPLLEKQRRQAAAFAALDLPGLAERRASVARALSAATNDLQDGPPFDVQTSQAWVRREFERLKLVLDGHPAPDAKADELHRKLAALADSLDAHGPKLAKTHLDAAAPVVQDVRRQLESLVAVEAPALLSDARGAVQNAESALRDGPKTDEARRRVRAAAAALGTLAGRLNGAESDLARVKRLAGNRKLAAERAMELVKMKVPFNAAASDEALRQLGFEVEELVATRVATAGQVHKKRVLALYAALRAKNEPDRLASDQKTLAEALDELAKVMADVAELKADGARGAPPAAAAAADAFLPSRPLAEALRDLANRQRALRARLTGLPAALASRLRAAEDNPFAALESGQRALAADVLALADRLAAGKEVVPAGLRRAADAAKLAADRLRVAEVRSVKDAGEAAAQLLREVAAGGAGRPWGKRADELAARQDAILDDLAKLFDSPGAATAQQVARAEELAGAARELSRLLELAAGAAGAEDATGRALADATKGAVEAATRLGEAAQEAADGDAAGAERLRAESHALLRAGADKVQAAAPKPPAEPNAAVGDALRVAELAMRKAIGDLDAGNAAEAEKAMRAAAGALDRAAKGVGKTEK